MKANSPLAAASHLLQGKTAVITGCNRGIGKAMLETFAASGVEQVWACVRTIDGDFSEYTQKLSEKFGTQITLVPFDLTDSETIKSAASVIRAGKKPVDILVNNAGVLQSSLFQMTPIDKMKEMFDINFFSQMLFTQYISKIMLRQRSGCIINLSSSAAIEGNEGRISYAASKASMITATKVLSKELAAANIRVNAIAPGLTQTDMMVQGHTDEVIEGALKRICMQRVGQPEEIANVALFLASDLSSYMTGQVLRVDGGM